MRTLTCWTALYRTRQDLSCEQLTTAGRMAAATSVLGSTLASEPAASTAPRSRWRAKVARAHGCGLQTPAAGLHKQKWHSLWRACNEPYAVLVITGEVQKSRQHPLLDMLRSQNLSKWC